MMICMIIIFGWQFILLKWYPPGSASTNPQVTQTTTAPVASTSPSTQSVVLPGTVPSAQGVPSISAPAIAPAPPTTVPAIVSIGGDSKYTALVKINPAGAGFESVTLKQFKGPGGAGQYVFQTPYDPANTSTYSMAARSISVNGTNVDLTSAAWKVDETRANSAKLSLDILSQGKPLIRITRTYELSANDSASKGYDHVFTQTYENLTNQPVTMKSVFNGPNTPPREIERGLDLQLIAGYNDDGEVVAFNHVTDSFNEKTPTVDMTASEKKLPLLWTGTASVYFDAILRPLPLDEKNPSPKYISKVMGEALNPRSDPIDRQVRLTLETDELKLGPNESAKLTSNLFLGPKQRSLLNSAYYDQFPRSYNKTLVIAQGACAYCTFQWLINILVYILVAFHAVVRDWGLAIIVLVFLVRAILHPITKRSQVSMMRMGKMAPEMERLKKKYADDKDALNKAMWELQKEQGMTPILGCAPMFLQMPIWIALYSALQSTFELRQAPFLYGLTWIHDLAKPDQLIKFAQPIPLIFFGWHLYSINLLPILMIGVTWLNQKYMPKPVAANPEQEQQQKMMQWMSMIFPLMFYAMPSGLNLYYVTSMGLGIIESKIIRDHIKQREEQEKEGRVIVDAPRGMKKKRGDEGGSAAKLKPKKPAPTGGVGKWLADLQSKAQEIKRQAERGGK